MNLSAVLTNGDEIQIGKFRLVFLTTHNCLNVDPWLGPVEVSRG